MQKIYDLVITIAFLLFILMGILILSASKSAVHEILGVLCLGFGFMIMGQAALLGYLRRNQQ